MSDTGNQESMTVCNYQTMSIAYASLLEVCDSLAGAYEKAATLAAEFTENYEGDAVAEVVPFLTSLPQHIYRLRLFYGKMAQYVAATSATFSTNDERMAEDDKWKQRG